MPLRLVKDTEDNSILARELRDKQVAKIVKWSANMYIGELVIRYGDRLMSFAGSGWEIASLGNDCRVRVIPNGIIELEVFDNE